MKAARQAKLEAQLSATESELRSLLLEALPHTAVHGDFLFSNSGFNRTSFGRISPALAAKR